MLKESEFNIRTQSECLEYINPKIDEVMELEEKVNKCIDKVKNKRSGVLGSLKALKKELSYYFILETRLSDLRAYTRKIQKYMISEMSPGSDEVSALIIIIQQVDKKLGVLYSLINTKINEILSSRITLTNIVLSIIAIVIAIIAITTSCG